jgi:uncharacterized membrane protein YdjX (TVP38/TMEM64 family)
MEIIELYAIFALTTGISSCYIFLAPAVALAREMNIQNTFTENTWLSYAIYITITTITAPFSILPIFIPSFAKRFKTGLEKSVMENQI